MKYRNMNKTQKLSHCRKKYLTYTKHFSDFPELSEKWFMRYLELLVK